MEFTRKITLLILFGFFVFPLGFGQGNFLDFDGSNDNVRLPENPSLSGISALTIESWVYLDGIPGNQVIYADLGSGNSDVMLQIRANGAVRGTLNRSTTRYGETAASSVSAGVWTHLAMVFDGSGTSNADRLQIFINGTPQSLSFTGTIQSTTPNAHVGDLPHLGSLRGTSAFLDGKMDEFRIWTTAKTQAEIQSSMNSALTGSEAGLYIYYNFDQGTCGGANAGVSTLNDLTTNGVSGTLNNFALAGCASNWVCGGATCGLPASFQPAAVPTLTEWGLILLGLGVLAMGTVVVWRRRSGIAIN